MKADIFKCIAISDIEKTGFLTRGGKFHCKRMFVGLINALLTFQGNMNTVVREFAWEICIIYLDDILYMSNNIEEHIMV